jgi:hypothetical protein
VKRIYSTSLITIIDNFILDDTGNTFETLSKGTKNPFDL